MTTDRNSQLLTANSPPDVSIIGAGGAGLLAGLAAAREGAQTVVYERMKSPARKVAISGGGRCNFSNTLDPRKFVKLFGDKNASHLGHALRAFSRDELVEMLKKYGVEGQIERNYRLYTKSGRGGDVVDALVSEFMKAGGKLVTQARITNIAEDAVGAGSVTPNSQQPTANSPHGLWLLEGKFGDFEEIRRSRTVVVCTGGLSYPVTGSTGDGYAWARTLGHGVTPLRAALVGLAVEEEWARGLQGLAWQDAEATLWPLPASAGGAPQGQPLCRERAEILFTHFGISGPAILDVSNTYVASGLQRALLLLDFFPDQRREELDAKILERIKAHPNRTAGRALDGMMPNRLLEHVERMLGADATTAVCRLPKAARQKLLDTLKSTRLTVTGTRGMEYGEVTAGGVEWNAIDPVTLESRLHPGLFFAGEILDLTGRCGGFNLQAAFSTGYLAGQNAARKARPS
jgi:predicted flavoprotein YhiN